MVPPLDKETRLLITKASNKFVTDKGQIAFEPIAGVKTTPEHRQVAAKYGLGEPIKFDPTCLLVDDAGFLRRQDNGRLLFYRTSGTCQSRNVSNARTITKELAEKLTGEEVDVEKIR